MFESKEPAYPPSLPAPRAGFGPGGAAFPTSQLPNKACPLPHHCSGRESVQRVKAQGRGTAAAQWADEVRALHKVAIVQHTAAAGFCLTESHLRPTAWHGADSPGGRRGRRPTAASHQSTGRHACRQTSSSLTTEEAGDYSRALFTAQAQLKEGDWLPPKAALPQVRRLAPARAQQRG